MRAEKFETFYFLSSWSLKAARNFLSIVLLEELAEKFGTTVVRHSIIKIVVLEALKRHRRKVFRVYDNFNLINFVF